MNDKDCSVILRHKPVSKHKRALDDMTFVAHAIEQRNIGGWQLDAFNIFAGTHPRFTGLTIKPRPRRKW
jgi:coproporphyrinogen III oxidase